MKKITFALFAVVMCFSTYSTEDSLVEEINELKKKVENLECELKKLKELKLQQVDKLSLAKEYISKQEYLDAIDVLGCMYKSDPNDKNTPQVLYLLASCFKKLNSKEKANIIFEKIVKDYSGEEYRSEFVDKAKDELDSYSKKFIKNNE